ncbi:hypothetical protein EJ04DRAFT_558252 [Polyplosphaeria fusca]|uniref:Uncharacterized protein n=1 Tax=Polyplosphaeria fusca TaxID=682080 RepID=A0A9P4R9A4_9PLEO|nr:hypothetical protein EJ04DRAFT_558252 [Polyplosphaeria fusca]
MADDDNFDIDIYGDEPTEDYQDSTLTSGDVKQEDTVAMSTDTDYNAHTDVPTKTESTDQAIAQDNSGGVTGGAAQQTNGTQHISSTGGSSSDQIQPPKQAPRQQGMKRKQGDDDGRDIDPGATTALSINDLNWWVSEEDIRGWANQSDCEAELVELTFNEHKVNGKSKGQVYVRLQTPQAATAFKRQLDTFYNDQPHTKKPTVTYTNPQSNPFKTLPKDVPARDKARGDRAPAGNYGGGQGGGGGNFNRGGFNNRGNFNRGGMNNNMGFQNRNFANPAGGNMGSGMGGYNAPGPMNNFSGGMGGMNNFGGGGGFNRGGMMGGNMRGGMNNRGGRGGNMGMGMGGMSMPMGGNMGGMGIGMAGGMMGMGGNMGMMGGMGELAIFSILLTLQA